MKRYWDLDYGLTWEEKLERRIKEARAKQKDAENWLAQNMAKMKEIEAEIARLKAEWNRGKPRVI